MYSERNILASTVPGAGWEEGTGIGQRLRDGNNRKWSKINDSQKKEEEKEKKKMDQIFSPNNPHICLHFISGIKRKYQLENNSYKKGG